jgi:3-hydroxyacyl-[acyl-carrier-protein] dehydratase
MGCKFRMEESADFSKLCLRIPDIMKYQQNRYPLLFIDEITEVLPGKSARGKKAFSYNEWFFPAHFEGDPNVPGFVQLESLVQVFLMTFLTLDGHAGQKTSFVSLEQAKFKRKIIPGETLNIYAVLENFKRGIAKGFAESDVNGEPAVSASFTIAIPEILSKFHPSDSNHKSNR